MVQDTDGQPTRIPPNEFAVAVVSPSDRRCLNPVVQRGRVPGMFFFAVPDAFLSEAGDYTVGLTAPGHRVLPQVKKIHVVH